MVKNLIKSISLISFIPLSLPAYSASTINILNSHEDLLTIISTFLKDNEHLSTKRDILQKNQIFSSKGNKRVIINNKYLIEFKETTTPCSWVSTLGITYSHGWGMKLFINRDEIGTICANKKSVIDPSTHSDFHFSKDKEGNSFFHFFNTGWWSNNSVFPTSITKKLNDYDKNYNSNALSFLIYNGDKIEQ